MTPATQRCASGRPRVYCLFLVALVVAPLVALAAADPSGAQEPPAPPTSTVTSTTSPTTTSTDDVGGDGGRRPEPESDDDEATEVVRGTLIDRKGTRDNDDDEPVEGVEITVFDADGDPVGTATSDSEGRYEIALDRPGAYTATLDTETLPDGVGLAEGRETLAFTIDPNQRRGLIFDLGARQRDTVTQLDRALQLGVEGIKFGLVIAITAIGLSLIFGTTGLTNFAHGELVTFGAIVAWYLNVDAGIHLLPATVLAMGVGAVGGGLLERGLWRPLRNSGTGLLAMMIISIGLSLLFRNVLLYWFGGSGRFYADFQGQRAIELGPVDIAPRDLWAIGISVAVILALGLGLQRTRTGKAMRAVADNPDLAASSGIDVDRVVLFVWCVGGALAALGGVLFAVSEQVNSRFGFELLLLMFAGITLGGLGTAYGALLGSFVVGVLVNLSTLWVAPDLKNVGALFVLILILLVRPQGLLGRAERIG